MIYQWREGARYPVPALVVGQELERIGGPVGLVTAAAVVEAARAPESALHPCFEWDDSVAAERYRENQARQMLRSIRIIDLPMADETPPHRFVHVSRQDFGSGYMATTRVMSDHQLREQVIMEAMRGLQAWRDRYASLHELADLFEAIDAVDIGAVLAV